MKTKKSVILVFVIFITLFCSFSVSGFDVNDLKNPKYRVEETNKRGGK